MSEDLKFCKDCKHWRDISREKKHLLEKQGSYYPGFGSLCARPIGPDLVTGIPQFLMKSAEKEREDHQNGCARIAEYFEPREEA